MLVTIKNLLARLLGITSPSLGWQYAFDVQVKKWLGITELEREVSRLQRLLNDQIKMVGIDIHQRNRRSGGVQTEIIFISHLGPEGMGSIRIVDAEFMDYGELMAYVKHVAEQKRPAIDGPMGMGRDFKGILDL